MIFISAGKLSDESIRIIPFIIMGSFFESLVRWLAQQAKVHFDLFSGYIQKNESLMNRIRKTGN